jgi:hypothetical protein
VLHGHGDHVSAPAAQIPRTPAGLRRRGKALWQSVIADFDLSEGEGALLLEGCRCLDDIEALQRAVADAPMTTIGSRGQDVVHPLRAELRSERLLLAKLLSQLDVPLPDVGPGKWDGLSASSRARKASRARWDNRGGNR